ncbi:MAG: hypothetical protein J6X52_04450, partial [Clostridia bacterium]|nr:hypothetical protein [Clostridia bacterium]
RFSLKFARLTALCLVTPQRWVTHAGTFAEKAEMTPERWVTHAGTFAEKANAPAGTFLLLPRRR